jgi:subfamily B ATP-binding cassette protein MsbA
VRLFLRTAGFLKPYWKQLTAVFLLSLLFVLFNSVSLWMSASFVRALFADQTPAATAPAAGPSTETGGADTTPGRDEGMEAAGGAARGKTAGSSGAIGTAAGRTGTLGINEYLKAKTNALIVRENKSDTLKILCIVILASFVLKSLCLYLKNVTLGFVEQRVATDFRDRLYEHLQTLSLSYFHNKRLGEIASVVMNDVGVLNSTLNTTFEKIIVTPINITWLTVLLFVINWKVALFFLVLMPVNGYFVAKVGSSIRRKSRRSQRQIAEVVATLHESLNNIKIVMAFAMNLYEVKRFKAQTNRYFNLVLRQKILQALSSPVTEVLGALIGVAILWYAGNQVLHDRMMTSEDFIRSLIIMFSILQPLKGIGGVNNALQAGLAAGERIFDTLDTVPTVTDKPDAVEIRTLDRGISVEGVSFRYAEELPLVLREVSLNVEKGEVVALVGPSGAGKSTLVDLIARFYDVTEGSVKIDGRDVRDIKIDSLRRLMGIVTQETILFNDTVRNNIAYGMSDVPPKAVEEAARIANASGFIEALVDGFETMIGERGVRLSGGQKQRLAIARAILQNPPILLLDEATSSLDSESEQLVQEALSKLMKDRTVIVIAHRLSTVIDANRIAVMNKGAVEALGVHDELLESSELYRKLYHMQFGFKNAAAEGVSAP